MTHPKESLIENNDGSFSVIEAGMDLVQLKDTAQESVRKNNYVCMSGRDALELIERIEKQDKEIKILGELVDVVNAAITRSSDRRTVDRLDHAMTVLLAKYALLSNGGDVK